MTNKDFSFKDSIKRLEEIVEKVESQDVDLEEAVELVEQAISLHQKCQQKLKSAHSKTERLFLEKGGELKNG